jgi:hypothetical protein
MDGSTRRRWPAGHGRHQPATWQQITSLPFHGPPSLSSSPLASQLRWMSCYARACPPVSISLYSTPPYVSTGCFVLFYYLFSRGATPSRRPAVIHPVWQYPRTHPLHCTAPHPPCPAPPRAALVGSPSRRGQDWG